MRPRDILVLLFSASVVLSACATPVGVKRADPHTVHRELTSSVLSTGKLSDPTKNVVFRRDLSTRYADDPTGAIAQLHNVVEAGGGNRDDIFALAEMSLQYAEDANDQSYARAAAVYAYAFLFPGEDHRLPDAFDPRLRLACDLYNRGITMGFASADGNEVELKAGTFALPFGELVVDFDPANLQWGSRTLTDFVPVAELQVRGLQTRYRWAGIGAPLAAGTEPRDAAAGFTDFVQPWAKVPVTAVLLIDDPRQQLLGSRVHATLEIEAASSVESVTIDGRTVPLEVESSASLAYMLAESPVWQQEVAGFLKGIGVIDDKYRLAALSPYTPGRIPVVFVHGTASSAGRWAEMLNELSNDSRLRGKFQFWLYSYNTGNPILYSAMRLRESLKQAVEELDPHHTDPALQKMVVVGHSQGGLLTKLTVVESGNGFWDDLSAKPLEQLTVSNETRTLLQQSFFVHPLPFVRRVIFIATPQRGSYFAGSALSHWAARFITFPLDVVHAGTDLVVRNKQAMTFASMGSLPTAVDNMTPGTSFIKILASLPVAPGVAAHSIIPVSGDGPFEDGDDGIVEYQSAHIDGVESELVVRSDHSCQANPHTIDEVRRILMLHLEETQ